MVTLMSIVSEVIVMSFYRELMLGLILIAVVLLFPGLLVNPEQLTPSLVDNFGLVVGAQTP
jgi:hypothetical protein